MHLLEVCIAETCRHKREIFPTKSSSASVVDEAGLNLMGLDTDRSTAKWQNVCKLGSKWNRAKPFKWHNMANRRYDVQKSRQLEAMTVETSFSHKPSRCNEWKNWIPPSHPCRAFQKNSFCPTSGGVLTKFAWALVISVSKTTPFKIKCLSQRSRIIWSLPLKRANGNLLWSGKCKICLVKALMWFLTLPRHSNRTQKLKS